MSTVSVGTCRGRGRSLIVFDRSQAPARVISHHWPDEPPEAIEAAVREYRTDRDRRCAPVSLALAWDLEEDDGGVDTHQDPIDQWGRVYRLESVSTRMSIPEVRWVQYPSGASGPGMVVSVRDVIGRLEDYEPVRTLSRMVARRYRGDHKMSVSTLRVELGRVEESSIVLNRGLREAALARVIDNKSDPYRIDAAGRMSMSEIAMRCGRRKYDSHGNVSGETSWLTRRLGIRAEGGVRHPTPWVHSVVLANIATNGLGLSPREVELG